MGQVLGIVYRVISGHLIQKAGFTRQTACTGAVTLIQPPSPDIAEESARPVRYLTCDRLASGISVKQPLAGRWWASAVGRKLSLIDCVQPV